jgi:hypothetical protein
MTQTTPDPTIVDWLLLKEAVDYAEEENEDGLPQKYAPAYERLYNQACKNAIAPANFCAELFEWMKIAKLETNGVLLNFIDAMKGRKP